MGKTSTRATKGQQARKGHKVNLGFEGGQMPLIRDCRNAF
jgi:ribosomal protein L15